MTVEPARRGLLGNLVSHPVILRTARALRIRQLADAMLSRLPVYRTLGTGIRFRLDATDAFLLAEELFAEPIYRGLEPYADSISTVADVGCNRGFFPLYLADLRRRTGRAVDLQGIAIDANQAMVERARTNLQANGLDGVAAMFGMVGAEGAEADFYLNLSDTVSSRFGGGKRVRVPVLSLQRAWAERCGERPCDVLKIDIEGSELELLRNESAFLDRVRLAVIEYHEPHSPREQVAAALEESGFELRSHEALSNVPASMLKATGTSAIGVMMFERVRPPGARRS